MRIAYLAAALALATAPSLAFAQAANAPAAAKPAASGHYTTEATPMGTLLADPAAKAIVAKYAPQIANSANADQMAQLTLKALQQFAPQLLTEQALQNIDYDFSKLPAKK